MDESRGLQRSSYLKTKVQLTMSAPSSRTPSHQHQPNSQETILLSSRVLHQHVKQNAWNKYRHRRLYQACGKRYPKDTTRSIELGATEKRSARTRDYSSNSSASHSAGESKTRSGRTRDHSSYFSDSSKCCPKRTKTTSCIWEVRTADFVTSSFSSLRKD